ncbi:MAG TPA: hypothetical protein VGY48_20500 [Vicinamibacterales bacterium]|nr:hypothetical protein [Vicinamibacterales bacterium]
MCACDPCCKIITDAPARGRNAAVAIWKDLVDDHAFPRGTRVCAASSCSCATVTPSEARVVITTAPDDEAQVDYGEAPMARDSGTGKCRRTRPTS